MIFFDYVFYRVCKAYSKTIESDPSGSAMCVIALMQGLNIMSCVFIFVVITQHKISLNNYLLISMAILLLVFNYIRYIYKEDRSYKILSETWINESNGSKIKNGILTTLYIVTSVCLCIGLAIYLGNQKNW